MNKNQGATIGAVLLTGLLLRPASQSRFVDTTDSKQDRISSTAAEQSSVDEGPWVASCNYWSPVRSLNEERGKSSSRNAAKAINDVNPAATTDNPKGTRFTVQSLSKESQTYSVLMENAKAREAPCPLGTNKRWGLPSDLSEMHLQTMIATVPDPAHSHASLGFDRAIDAIVEAAEDNHYTSSYFWLPWKSRVRLAPEFNGSNDKEPGHDPERERQPGLIIFKHIPSESEDNSPKESYYRVIYLFLVSETATEGVNGDEIRRALTYQRELEQKFIDNQECVGANYPKPDPCFSTGRKGHAFIGPNYTGSIASLRAAINAYYQDNSDKSDDIDIEIAGATSSMAAERQLTDPDARDSIKNSLYVV